MYYAVYYAATRIIWRQTKRIYTTPILYTRQINKNCFDITPRNIPEIYIYNARTTFFATFTLHGAYNNTRIHKYLTKTVIYNTLECCSKNIGLSSKSLTVSSHSEVLLFRHIRTGLLVKSIWITHLYTRKHTHTHTLASEKTMYETAVYNIHTSPRLLVPRYMYYLAMIFISKRCITSISSYSKCLPFFFVFCVLPLPHRCIVRERSPLYYMMFTRETRTKGILCIRYILMQWWDCKSIRSSSSFLKTIARLAFFSSLAIDFQTYIYI